MSWRISFVEDVFFILAQQSRRDSSEIAPIDAKDR